MGSRSLDLDDGDVVVSSLGLTSQEASTLKSFTQQCQERGLLKPPASLTPEDVTDGLYDEMTLLRFLRARSFDIPGALAQFSQAQSIRSSIDAVQAYNTIPIEDFERTREMYPHWTGRTTLAHHPLCTFDISALSPAALAEYGALRGGGSSSSSRATTHAVVFHDYLTRFVLPLCSAAAARPVTGAVYLVDVAALTVKQAWAVRNYAQDISRLLATCYPEVVERVYVLNASSVFARVWGLLRKWVDARTADKLVFVPAAEVFGRLSEVIGAGDIPVRYGGGFEGGKRGLGLSGRLCDELGAKEVPPGPVKWILNDGRRRAVAVGMEGGKMRMELMCDVVENGES